MALLAMAAVGATLPTGNWHPPVREALQRAIDRRAGDPDAYAVFDFDNTCAVGDYAMLTAFADMDVGLVFDTRPDADSPLGKLLAAVRAGTAEKRFLVQGRDERIPGLCRASESILVPSTIYERKMQND